MYDFNAARASLPLSPTPTTYHEPLHLHFKWENFQPTKSFKVRGALHKILAMPPEQTQRGLITGSAGNHGQAVALAARQLNIPAQIFVPSATPRVKTDRMLSLGAEVIRVPGLYSEAEAQAIRTARQTGQTFVSPYNDPDIITGAGTVAVEWLTQVPALERILVPVGGGGLICGVGLAAKQINPNIEIIGVLSVASPYLYHQFYEGHMRDVVEQPTLTDGLAGAVEDGSITIDLISQAADAIIQLEEDEIAQAIVYAQNRLGETVEGSGAVGLAAVLAGKVSTTEKVTGAVVTGGNIDPDKLQQVLAASKNERNRARKPHNSTRY